MKEVSYKTFFSTLSNGRRLDVLQSLIAKGPRTVTQIVADTGLEQSAVSHILSKLQACEVVHVSAEGRQRTYSANAETIQPLFALIDRHIETFCTGVCENCTCAVDGRH